MVDTESAIAFVVLRGSARERARLRYLLYSERPAPEVLDQLHLSQRADGSWPSEDGFAFDVHTTLEALKALQLRGRV